jgi:hypothetical protein
MNSDMNRFMLVLDSPKGPLDQGTMGSGVRNDYKRPVAHLSIDFSRKKNYSIYNPDINWSGGGRRIDGDGYRI